MAYIKAADGNLYPAEMFANPNAPLYGNGFFQDPENIAALGALAGNVAGGTIDIVNRAKAAKQNKAKGIGASFFDRTAAAAARDKNVPEGLVYKPSFMQKYGLWIVAGVVVLAVVYFFVIKKK